MKKTTICLILTMIICSLFVVPAMAHSNDVDLTKHENAKAYSPSDGSYFYCKNSEVRFEDSTYIFIFESSEAIETISYTENVLVNGTYP